MQRVVTVSRVMLPYHRKIFVWSSNASSDSDGDLPQAGPFQRFSESWLNCPRWWAMIMPCPLVGSAFVHQIFFVRISLLFEQKSHMQTMLFLKMQSLCLSWSFWKCIFFSRTSKFCNMWCQLKILQWPLRIQDTFVTVCFWTNPCFS